MDENQSQDDPKVQATQDWAPSEETQAGNTHSLERELETAIAGAAMDGGMPRLNRQFGRYRVEKQLGRGGMGAVYLAYDEQLGRRVALKVPFLGKGRDDEVASRFLREARAAATLDHPNICPVHEVGEIDGVQYLAMAYVDGRPLSAYIAAGKALPTKQVAAVVRKMAIALQEAHEKGIIHRDLKPANVMVNQRKEPVIMDFGLAQRPNDDETRLTQTGMILGTPAYMSPEQIRAGGGEMGPEVDIYSLGVMFYELLTGELPFTGPPHSVIGQILTDRPLSPRDRRADLDERVNDICMKAMAKSAVHRYGSMREFAADLRSYIQGEPSPTAIMPLTPPPIALPPIAEPVAPPQAGETVMIRQMFDDISLNARVSSPKPAPVKPRRRNDSLFVWATVSGLGLLAVALGFVWFSANDRRDVATGTPQIAPEKSSKLTASVEAAAKPQGESDAKATSDSDQKSVIPAFTAEDVAKIAEQAPPEPPPPAKPMTNSTSVSTTPTGPAPAPPPASKVTSTPEPTPPAEPTKPVAASAKAAAKKKADDGPITIDGKNTEWRTLASVADIRGDANGGDLSRDIVRTAVLYTYDDLYVLIETAEKPASKTYWLNLDLNLDGKEDLQMTVIPGGAFWVAIFADGAVQLEGTGATCVIDDVYEMRLPLDFLVDVMPETASVFRGRNAAAQIGIIAFTADPPDHRFVDFAKPLISNRRVRLSK